MTPGSAPRPEQVPRRTETGDRQQRASERPSAKRRSLDVEDPVTGVGAVPRSEHDAERQEVGYGQKERDPERDSPVPPRAENRNASHSTTSGISVNTKP